MIKTLEDLETQMQENTSTLSREIKEVAHFNKLSKQHITDALHEAQCGLVSRPRMVELLKQIDENLDITARTLKE